MKNIVVAVSLLATTALGGCAGMSAGQVSTQVSAIEAEVQADANLVCGFVPTAATILQFIPAANTVSPAAASIAEAVCAAVAAAPPIKVQSARLKSLTLLSNGKRVAVNVATVVVPGVGPVPISGQFTR